MGFVSGIRSMPKSISRSGGTLGKSSGKTSGNSLTIRTDSKGGVSTPRP